MIKGINFITDEKGNQKGILLDLIVFKKENIKAIEVMNSLKELQQLIDNAGVDQEIASDWDRAKNKLKNIKI